MAFAINHNSGSATSVIELPSYPHHDDVKGKASMDAVVRTTSHRSHEAARSLNTGDGLPSSSLSAEEITQWNHPRINIARTAAAFWTFIVLGMNDAAYGVS